MQTSGKWRKSSYSNSQGNCVEVGTDETALVAVRDSKLDEDAPHVLCMHEDWRNFLDFVDQRTDLF